MKLFWVIATALVLTACGAESPTSAPDLASSETTTTTTSITAVEVAHWPAGTVTCAELEGNFPNGVDDHAVFIDQGIVTFYDQPVGAEQTIQFMDDPTCTIESEAWEFMIGYLLDPAALCDWHHQLPALEPRPKNLATVLTHLADAERLCS